MAHRLRHVIWVSLVGASALLFACSDDATDGTNDSSAGDSSGGDASGSASGGSSAGKGGSTSGGKAGAGTAGTSPGGEGGASGEGGAAAGGEPALGGAAGDANQGDGGAEMGGAGGADGGLEYACKTTTIVNELCSALFAANCSDPTDCADCVQTRAGERETFADCPACLAQHDAFFQCGIDAYESGNLSAGIECYPGFGADLNDSCVPYLNQAVACSDYALENGCPQAWPVN